MCLISTSWHYIVSVASKARSHEAFVIRSVEREQEMGETEREYSYKDTSGLQTFSWSVDLLIQIKSYLLKQIWGS